jgi:ribonuclease D
MQSSPNLPWRKASYVGPATVQISVVDASLVLQIAQEDVGAFEEALPVLQKFLADATILKAGVGIDQDMIELFRWESSSFSSPLTDARSRLDIGGIGGSVGGGRTSSLKNLAKAVLSVDLPKSKKLAMSNWAKVPLTKDQVTYAARDAWAAAAILHELERRDPNTYSTASLLELVLADECPMDKLNARAVARKEAKTKVLAIMGSGDEKVNRKDLSEEKLKEVEQLEQEMKELAPPRPTIFNVGPLGLAL